MKLMFLIVIHLCQAYQNISTLTVTTTPHPAVFDHDTNQPELPNQPYVFQHNNGCSWSLRLLGPGTGQPVVLTTESRDALVHHICQDLGCGGVYGLTEASAPPNSTCLTSCSYLDHQLQNCSQVVESDCTSVSKVICGHQAVRLAGGGDRCAGRVELWRDGLWGTVCDDEWDTREGHVVCAQLGCGYALSVSEQGGPVPVSVPQGRGPIYLDELNCTGGERSLWECPSTGEEHDCGHKEDAGVVCSEIRAVRLIGGLDQCSGKVEIHRNGTWGTVCNDCWTKDEASLVCSMLGCGQPVQYVGFEPPFSTHNNGTKWYYICAKEHRHLWECKEFANPIFCFGSTAAALICNDSRGLPDLKSTTQIGSTSMTLILTTPGTKGSEGFPLSLELLGCVALSLALLLALIINTLLCCQNRRKQALLVQQKHASLREPTEHHENEYRDSVHLTNFTNSHVNNDGLSNPRLLIHQQSSKDSNSVDSDYEPCDADSSFHLSTFRNSQRPRTDMLHPTLRASALDSLSEEGCGSSHVVSRAPANHQPDFISANGHQVPGCHSANPSVDSFDSSSTSSGECYENTRPEVLSLQTPGVESSSDEGPLYSPVSPEPEHNLVSSASDYDDVA